MTTEDTNPEFPPEQVSLSALFRDLHHHVAADETPYDLASGLAQLTSWMADTGDTPVAAENTVSRLKPAPTESATVVYAGFSVLPRHRAIVAIDIEGSTTRTNTERAMMRSALYDMVEEALEVGGITEQYRDPLIDRGDGVLVLIHPSDHVPKTVLLNRVIPTLSALLAEHTDSYGGKPLRVRAAVHGGEVHYDRRGCYGEDIDLTFRLLDSPDLKGALALTSEPLALVVSNDLHRAVVRHGYDGIDDRAFSPLVTVSLGGERHRGWVHVPGTAEIDTAKHDLTA